MATQFLCRMLSRSLTIKQRPIIGITSNNRNNRGCPGLFCPLSFGMATSSKGPRFPSLLGSGFDDKHWLVVMDIKAEAANKSRDELINFYVKTLADGIGVSEEEAKMKLYSVFTKYNIYSFGANISLEEAKKLEKCQHALHVYPDYYIDIKNKDYGGEPVINGQVAAYDDKYYERIRRVREGDFACTEDDGGLHNSPDDVGALHNGTDDDDWVICNESYDDAPVCTFEDYVDGMYTGPDKYNDTDTDTDTDTDEDRFAPDEERFAAADARIAGTA